MRCYAQPLPFIQKSDDDARGASRKVCEDTFGLEEETRRIASINGVLYDVMAPHSILERLSRLF